MDRLRNVAVVLAGGVGARVGMGVPKQLLEVAGKPVIAHTIAVFERSPLIDEIVVMMTPGYEDRVRAIVSAEGSTKVSRVLAGSTGTRSDTVVTALTALGDQDCNVLLHDAVRPLVTPEIIAANVEALASHEAVHTAIPSTDTVIEVDPAGPTVARVLPRAPLQRGQTPQSFRLATIRAAYAAAARDPHFAATDDSTVVLRYLPGVPIAVVPGHERNLKITQPIDLYLAEQLLRLGADGVATA